jgi:hypothetical protein
MPAATREPENCFRGLRAKFDLSAPSPNAFRPYAATLDRAAADDMCTLVIDVCARVAGEHLLARVKLRGGARPTMDVRVSPAIPTLER